MRVVNLAHRPFINRRPIVRFAALLWLAGVLLLLWNVRLYRNHWQGTTDNRRELADKQADLAAERQALGQQARRLGRIDLRQRNSQSAFLNSLISYRTFPWSALFDDLEEVLPAQVKLFNVQPVVKLADEVAQQSRRAARQRAAAERASRRGRPSQRRRGTSADAQDAEPAPPIAAVPEPQLAPDEVALQLNGLAKSEDDLVELVDRLYADPLFRRPVLDSEHQDANRNATVFSLFVVYLTHRQPMAPPPRVAEEGPGPGGAVDGEALTDGQPAAETLADGQPAAEALADGDDARASLGALPQPAGEGSPGGVGPRTARADGGGVPGTPDRATPDRATPGRGAPGRVAAQPGTPDRVVPDRGTVRPGPPYRGSPDRGTPDRDSQTSLPAPDRGAPDRGAPDRATPDRATPDRATPDRATADTGAADRGREDRESETVPADEEPGLRERDASATPAIDRGGQVFLRPHLRRPGIFQGTGAMDLAEVIA